MIRAAKVLPRRERPTKRSYRAAVADVIRAVQGQHRLSDDDLGDRLGCSGGTIKNARNELTNLDGVTLLNLEYEFGPAALDPVMALGGSRLVPTDIGDADDANAFVLLTEMVHKLALALDPAGDGGKDITAAELQALAPVAKSLRQSMDVLIDRAERERVRLVAA